MKYNIVYADPPWKYDDTHTNGAAENHYPTMQLEDIKKYWDKELAADDCILFLWTTFPIYPKALEVIKSWGFTYKTIAFLWIKINKNGKEIMGIGNWTRSNAESCLLATKGKPHKFIRIHSMSQIIKTGRKAHSRKPPEVREKIIQLCGDLPRIELFSRDNIEGWDVAGNEVPMVVQPRMNSIICPICKKSFVPKRSDADCCSDKCRSKKRYKRHRIIKRNNKLSG